MQTGSDELRRLVPAAAARIQLNTGTAGPLLDPAAGVMRRMAAGEVERGRADPDGFETLLGLLDDVRASLAALVGADPDQVAITHNTSEGLNIALWGMDWRRGDRIVTTSLEHPGALLPLLQIAHRLGVEVDVVDIGVGEPQTALGALTAALARPCRLLVVSHVTWSTGALLPLAEIVAAAHAASVAVLVDGAQAVGAVPVDCAALDCDLYAFSGQKWLCGPEGTGGLVVRRDLDPTFAGVLGAAPVPPVPGRPVAFRPGAARHEVGTVYRPGLGGLKAASDWHRLEAPGWDVFGRITELAAYCREAVGQALEAEVVTPAGAHAGLVAFRVAGLDARACAAALQARGVIVRDLPGHGMLRFSCGFFNTEDEIDRAVALVAGLARA